MANRNFANGGKIYSMNVMPVLITAKAVIGAAGAVTAVLGSTIASIVRISTGVYQITLQDVYQSSLTVQSSMESPASGLSGIVAVETQHLPSASISILGASTCTITTINASGVAADPASGSSIAVLIIANNSSVKTS